MTLIVMIGSERSIAVSISTVLPLRFDRHSTISDLLTLCEVTLVRFDVTFLSTSMNFS